MVVTTTSFVVKSLEIELFVNQPIQFTIAALWKYKLPVNGWIILQRDCYVERVSMLWWRHGNIQWNLSVTTTSIIKLITCDLFNNVF